MQLVVTLSPRLQRIIALTLAAVPVLFLGTAFATFVESQIDRHEQAALLTRKIARERAVLTQASQWNEKLSELRSSPDWQALLVPKSPSQNGPLFTLVQTVGNKIEQSSMRRMETSGAVEIDEYVSFSATTEQLAKILQSLRGLRPLFVVRSISVESSKQLGPADNSAPNILQIRLTVAEFEHP